MGWGLVVEWFDGLEREERLPRALYAKAVPWKYVVDTDDFSERQGTSGRPSLPILPAEEQRRLAREDRRLRRWNLVKPTRKPLKPWNRPKREVLSGTYAHQSVAGVSNTKNALPNYALDEPVLAFLRACPGSSTALIGAHIKRRSKQLSSILNRMERQGVLVRHYYKTSTDVLWSLLTP